MNERLRKKKHLGEFREMGFDFAIHLNPTSALNDVFEEMVAQQSFHIYRLKRCFFTGSKPVLMPRAARINRWRSSGRPGRQMRYSHSSVGTIKVA